MDLFDVRKKLSMGIPIYKIKLRVTDYSRVSTDHLEQKKSLINQTEYFNEMIKNNNNWTYVEGYVDEGISGTSDKKRNNFMRMIQDAQRGKFDLIITKEISRFSRNTLDSIKYTRELLSYGVGVYFLNDNINTILPDSELRLTIMASLAQDEIRRLSERVKFGMNRSIKKEVILGNNSLLGYDKDKNTGCLVINKKEAIIIKEIFSMYVIDKLSLNKIAFNLNNTYKDRKWSATGVERIITNPKYKGYYCGKKTEVVDYITKRVKIIPKEEWTIYKKSLKIPVIIEEELWELANKRLLSRKKKKENYLQNNHLFSGKLFCQNDLLLFHRRRQCKKNNEISWLCSNYLKNGKQFCVSPNVRESELLYIFNEIIKCLDISFIKDMLMKLYNKLFFKKKLSNNNLDNIVNDLLNSLEVRDKIIKTILNKILISSNNNDIFLEINLNLVDDEFKKIKLIIQDKVFTFKRGFDSNSTKRYAVKYRVSLNDDID